jgi:hypothetical protein
VAPLWALTEVTAARIGPAHGAQTKPSAPPTANPLRKPSPRDTLGELRDEQNQAEGQQHDDGERAGGPGGEADAVDELGQRHDRDRERDGQTDDDAQGTAAAADRAGAEEGGEDRQHAGRDGGSGAGDQREQQQQGHRVVR